MGLSISMLDSPKIQGNRREFIYHRDGVAVLGQVYRFDVVVAAIASLDAYVAKIMRGINLKLTHVLFATPVAQNSTVGPLMSAQRTNQ